MSTTPPENGPVLALKQQGATSDLGGQFHPVGLTAGGHVAASPEGQTAHPYLFTGGWRDLGLPKGSWSYAIAQGVDDSDNVLVGMDDPSGSAASFVAHMSAGPIKWSRLEPPNRDGYNFVYTGRIDSDGVVPGTISQANEQSQRPAEWVPLVRGRGFSLVLLKPVPGFAFTRAIATARLGKRIITLGSAIDSTYESHPVLWSPSGRILQLTLPSGAAPSAAAVDIVRSRGNLFFVGGNGQIDSATGPQDDAFRWQVQCTVTACRQIGTAVEVPYPPAMTFSGMSAMNAAGWIVGFAGSATSPFNTFLWPGSGIASNLDDLIPQQLGLHIVGTVGINASDQVLAAVELNHDAQNVHAMILTPSVYGADGTPGSPSDVSVSASNGGATLTWTSPSNTGTSPISSYQVLESSGNGFHEATAGPVTCTGNACSVTVTGLRVDCVTQYQFAVVARNGSGWGNASVATQPILTSGVLSSGAPHIAMILIDGAPSTEVGGKYYPVGSPAVDSYCPLTSTGDRATFPEGLADSMARWSEFPAKGGSSSSGSSPTSGIVCLDTLDSSSCLTASLAARGAVLIPYSYKGVSFAAPGLLNVKSYGPDDSAHGNPSTQLLNLALEIQSIHTQWPSTQIGVVAHSWGGALAEMYWQCSTRLDDGDHGKLWTCPQTSVMSASASVLGVVSLDSPINGVAFGGFGIAYGPAIRQIFTWNWAVREDRDRFLALADAKKGGYTAVGTLDDSTYIPWDGHFAGIDSQVLLDCTTNTACSPDKWSFASPCKATSAIDGTVYGHDTPKVCPAVIQKIELKIGLA